MYLDRLKKQDCVDCRIQLKAAQLRISKEYLCGTLAQLTAEELERIRLLDDRLDIKLLLGDSEKKTEAIHHWEQETRRILKRMYKEVK